MNNKTALTIIVFVLVLAWLAGCQTPASAPIPTGTEAQTEKTAPTEQATQPGIANPASENCTSQGGTLTIEERGDGGQFGVCYFEDNRQCEEWALMRGDCPAGGLKVTGYITSAARYCAITGGTYAVTGNNGTEDEQGTCAFKDGSQCDAWEYYNGECTPSAAPAPAGTTIQPLTMEVCNGQAQAMSHALDDLVPTQSEAPLEDFITGAKGTGCQATITGSGAQFESPNTVVKSLGSLLAEQGWTEDMMLESGGPTGMGAGYRKGEQLCYASAMWEPDASANCPKDQPITACPVTPEQQLYTITLNCGVERSSTSTASTLVPLKDALANLQPQDVFRNFYDITQVPRPSGQMDQIRKFLVNFGEGLGLETRVDDAGNVLIRKPASAGFENRQGVVLQAHMDMVPQKVDGKEFDFATDPIPAFVDADYIVTDGTSLGADDGIGMALIMAILQSKTLQAGPLEALFTADEETTMSGASGLKGDLLKGRILINLDGEIYGEFIIGSAGGAHANIFSTYPQAPAPADMSAYQVKVQGLKGGHSGVDINLGRGHATKILARLLKEAAEPYGLRLASISGGTAFNAIPRDAAAVVFIAEAQVDGFLSFAKEFEARVQNELRGVEPALKIEVTRVQAPVQVMDEDFQKALINALYGTPQGVLRMSAAVPGLVETSINLGVTNVKGGQVEVIACPRSSVDSELFDAVQMMASVWELAGYSVEITDSYSGWAPNPDSPILGLMQAAYRDLSGKEAVVTAVHAGLECGTIGEKVPGMDMISLGPTMSDVHTPAEKLYIPSVEKTMVLLTEVLQQIPE
jgi:dipeptidase D